jgi:uridine phosphorylase
MKHIGETDLILNPDGSAYHIKLLPKDVADTVITVGDADRVPQISKHFDHIECKKGKREFITHTGTIGTKRLTVISTGIGTGNVDIVLNELDALINIDLQTRQPVANPRSLNFIRIGTSGAIQEDIEVDSLLVSSAAFGLDPIMHFYMQSVKPEDEELLAALAEALPAGLKCDAYVASADEGLLSQLATGIRQGITMTAPGFYAPQGRMLRGELPFPGLLESFSKFEHKGQKITNLEMETAGIYGLADTLGHRPISFNMILANRVTHRFSKDPGKTIDKYIRMLLERIASMPGV